MLENEQIDNTIMQVLEGYIKTALYSDTLKGCIAHMTLEEKQQYTDRILKYFEKEIKTNNYHILFGTCNPKIIAATIIYKSLIPKNINHLTIYGYHGAQVYSLITWRELGEILHKPNLVKSYHHYNKINIESVELDIDRYNKFHYLGLGHYRHVVEQSKCPHCGKYI